MRPLVLQAITFVDNHSTGSEPRHWPFPDWGVMLGYAYILTHPGTPCVFWDHVHAWKLKVGADRAPGARPDRMLFAEKS